MLTTGRSERVAGGSAGQRFEGLVRSWRRRALRPIFWGTCALVVALSVAGTIVPGQARFWLGMLAGGTISLYMALRDSPPWHIEKWRIGQEGERRTAKALRKLPSPDWRVWHDLPGRSGTNVDHVVLGPAGLFLLDSENYSGEAAIEGGELRVRWLEDREDGWTCHGLVPRMRAASAELSERIESATGVRAWVQPVVVLWMPFTPERADVSGVCFVQGQSLAAWLLGRRLSGRARDATAISSFLHDISKAAATETPRP
jgi:hypothetical protein